MLKMWRSSLTAEQAAGFTEAVTRVASVAQPLLGPAREVQAKLLGLDDSPAPQSAGRRSVQFSRSEVTRAEVFTDGKQLVAVSIRETEQRFVVNSRTGTPERDSAGLFLMLHALVPGSDSALVGEVKEAIESAMGLQLEPYYYKNGRFDELAAGEGGSRAIAQAPPQERLDAARILADKDARALATAVKSSMGGLLIADAGKSLAEEARPRAAELQGALVGVGVVAAEIVIVCRRTQQQVARAESEEKIALLGDQGIRCGCGKAIGEERVEQALTITELGRELLDKSHWMSIILLDGLMSLGVNPDRILIEYAEGGDEMDCITEISGELALFELKDKAFNLGQAYSFGAKMSIVRPRHAVIVTTDHVGGDARDHFERAQQASRGSGVYRGGPDPDDALPVVYIEGIENLPAELAGLVGRIYRVDGETALRDLFPFAALSPAEALSAIEDQG